ncbi:MAG: hypothetical protein IPM21_00085 [Acidobacteria bacterium]|nr:hypothetical protein [Acidobacteriota bacterium]
MNVFEDLIEELKEENLLEETVIDIERSKVRPLAIEEVPAETDPIADTEEDSFAFAESDGSRIRRSARHCSRSDH